MDATAYPLRSTRKRSDRAIMKLFSKLISKAAIEQPADCVPAIKYVNLLIMHAISVGQSELLVRESVVLPTLSELFGADGKPDFPHAHLPPPPFNVISNRLKVMAGCIPMKHKTSVSGTFRVHAAGREYELAAQFDEVADEPFCKLTIKGEMSQPVAGAAGGPSAQS